MGGDKAGVMVLGCKRVRKRTGDRRDVEMIICGHKTSAWRVSGERVRRVGIVGVE